MKAALLLAIAISFLTLTSFAQKKDDPLPLAKLEAPVTVSYESKDLEWLRYGGFMVATVLVDKKGKLTVMDLTGPGAPCGELSSEHLLKLRTAAIDAFKKVKADPVNGPDGNPVESGAKITLKVPATDPTAPTILPVTGNRLPVVPKIIQAGVVNGKAISLVKPEYPSEARANHAWGPVSVQVMIDEDGKVMTAGAVSGNPYLRYAAADAACRSKFSTTTLSGRPIKVTGVITYNFVP